MQDTCRISGSRIYLLFKEVNQNESMLTPFSATSPWEIHNKILMYLQKIIQALEEMVFSKNKLPDQFWRTDLYNRITLAFGSILNRLSQSGQHERSLRLVGKLHNLLGMHGK